MGNKMMDYFNADMKRILEWKESADSIVKQNGDCKGIDCDKCCNMGIKRCTVNQRWCQRHSKTQLTMVKKNALLLAKSFLEEYKRVSK